MNLCLCVLCTERDRPRQPGGAECGARLRPEPRSRAQVTGPLLQLQKQLTEAEQMLEREMVRCPGPRCPARAASSATSACRNEHALSCTRTDASRQIPLSELRKKGQVTWALRPYHVYSASAPYVMQLHGGYITQGGLTGPRQMVSSSMHGVMLWLGPRRRYHVV